MSDIKRLANQFRCALESARDAGDFDGDIPFGNFPRGCCGDSCDLLAHFLHKKNISTNYVCGTYYNGSFEDRQSHAWLLTDNKLIIDITGDQFRNDEIFLNYDTSVYVGKEDDFHRLFEVDKWSIHNQSDIDGFDSSCQARLHQLYEKITKYI